MKIKDIVIHNNKSGAEKIIEIKDLRESEDYGN